MNLPTCNAPKYSQHTLSSSGTILGLSPPSTLLSRINTMSFLDQLIAKQEIAHNRRTTSLTLLDSETGILSFGTTLAVHFEEAKLRIETQLKHLGDLSIAAADVEMEITQKLDFAISPDSKWDDHFKWTAVQGARGWWNGLMSGVWVNGVKVLKNQPILLDINSPFIIAPGPAVAQFYNGVSGARQLAELEEKNERQHFEQSTMEHSRGNTARVRKSRFHLFPCLNSPSIVFEIGGWNFPVMSGEGNKEDSIHGPSGGRFSIGKFEEHIQNGTVTGNGYCVGAVVEGGLGAETGLKDTWILGEPFFRGLGVVLDHGEGKNGRGARIGVRSY